MNSLKWIQDAVAKGNSDTKPKLIVENTHYLESFKRNDREKEYQAYISSVKEIEK